MEILYSAIIQGSRTLAEQSKSSNRKHNGVDLRALAIAIAAQAKPGEKVAVTANRLTGYYFQQQSSGRVIVAIGDDNAPKRILLQFLKEVDSKLSTGAENYAAILNDAQNQVTQNRDSIHLANSEINDVKQVLINNIDLLLERGERVNLLVDRTSDMSQSANIFNRQATQLQRRMWFQNFRMVFFGVVLLSGAGLVAVKVL